MPTVFRKNEIMFDKIELAEKNHISFLWRYFDYSIQHTPKIKAATKNQLQNYRLIGGGRGIHFPEIDEDISLVGIIQYKLSHELLAS